MKRDATRRVLNRFEARVQATAFKAAMGGLRLGIRPTAAELALLKPEDRYAYEAAQHQHDKEGRPKMSGEQYETNVMTLAELRGEQAAHRQLALGNPEYVEAMRLQCWHRNSPKSLRIGDDRESVICPPGWPVGVDGEQYIAAEYDSVAASARDRARYERWKQQNDAER